MVATHQKTKQAPLLTPIQAGDGSVIASGDWEDVQIGHNSLGVVGAHGTVEAGNWSRAIVGDFGVAISGGNGQSLSGIRGLSVSGEHGYAYTSDGGMAIAGFDDAVRMVLKGLIEKRKELKEPDYDYDYDALLDEDDMNMLLSLSVEGSGGVAHAGAYGIALAADRGSVSGGAMAICRGGECSKVSVDKGGVVVAGEGSCIAIQHEEGHYITGVINDSSLMANMPYELSGNRLIVATHIPLCIGLQTGN